MNIIEAYQDLTPEERYELCVSPLRRKVSEVAEATLEVVAWAHYTDLNNKGEEVELMSIKDAGGTVFVTNSATFARDFKDIIACGFKVPMPLYVRVGTSKNGRTFYGCGYVPEQVFGTPVDNVEG